MQFHKMKAFGFKAFVSNKEMFIQPDSTVTFANDTTEDEIHIGVLSIVYYTVYEIQFESCLNANKDVRKY